MDKKYYIKNILWGLIFVAIAYYSWQENSDNKKTMLFFYFSVISCVLYPFSKKLVENVIFKFTKKEFWQQDFFTSSVGGSMQAILFLLCFIFAVPFSVLYIVYLFLKKKTLFDNEIQPFHRYESEVIMNRKYYINNIIWGVFFLCVFLWQSNIWLENNLILAWTLLIINTLLYPLSKKPIERIALLYTTKEFWHRGIFTETAGKSGLYAMYYMFCFIFSIPFGISYLIYLNLKKSPTER
ncbi:TPA: colicin E1 family microcin immunity protein [Yersinia enterocolitica]